MNKNLVFLTLLIVFIASANFAMADNVINLPNPLCPEGASSENCVRDVPTLVRKITDYILVIIGALATLMFVWAGILFVISAGEPGQITKARNALMWAAIGLGIALAGSGLLAVIREIIGTNPSNPS